MRGVGSAALALTAAALVISARASAAPPFGPPARTLVLFGHIASLRPSGHRYLMRLDPALWLSGKTASDYALAKTGSADVPNDHIVFDPEHGLLSFYIAANAKVTVVANARGGIRAQAVSVAQLVRVLDGKLSAFEPKNPFWAVVSGDTVTELDQQYSP